MVEDCNRFIIIHHAQVVCQLSVQEIRIPAIRCKFSALNCFSSLIWRCVQAGGVEAGWVVAMGLSLPLGADRFFTICIENAGYQSDPYIVSATKTADFNLPIIN
jgi:hypothetical protein